MTVPRIGSLFTGYGGLDIAAEHVFGGETVWCSDIDPGASKIINHRWPDAPNLGDITKIDWATVPPVEILTGGYPCQPFSKSGNRKGTNDERHLWPYVREAIRQLRPRYTILENVAGHRSLGFDRVLGDLAEDGMHVRWTSVRAADIGAPHSRERIFIAVTDAGSKRHGPREDGRGMGRMDREDESETPQRQRPWTVAGNRTGPPAAADSLSAGLQGAAVGASDTGSINWRGYTDAVRRWESILRRPAPTPNRLAEFEEWMMGLPAGWVTAVPGLSRSAQVKALGNGVVPQQAIAALRILLEWEAATPRSRARSRVGR